MEWFPEVERLVVEVTATAALVCESCRFVRSAIRHGFGRQATKKQTDKESEELR